MRRFVIGALVCALWAVPAVQTPAEPAKIQLNGLLDTYLGYKLNNPPGGANQNIVRAFDQRSSSLELSLLELTIKQPAEPVGFTLTRPPAKQRTWCITTRVKTVSSFSSRFVSARRWADGRLTSASSSPLGAEVIESTSNDNYSRSLPFVYAIPFYHAGIRATASLGAGWGVQVMVVNGWDITEENNSKKSLHAALTYSDDRLSFVQNVITGDEAIAPASGTRMVWDTVLFYKSGADKYGINLTTARTNRCPPSGWGMRSTIGAPCRESVSSLCATSSSTTKMASAPEPCRSSTSLHRPTSTPSAVRSAVSRCASTAPTSRSFWTVRGLLPRNSRSPLCTHRSFGFKEG